MRMQLTSVALVFTLAACVAGPTTDSSAEKMMSKAEPTKAMMKQGAEPETEKIVKNMLAAGVCEGFGPQTPRDIASTVGTNGVVFPVAPTPEEMNLCNIHFHNAAEHKAPAFSIKKLVEDSDSMKHGDGGFQCSISKSLTSAELAPYAGNMCDGVKPGDTIEVHWVHSTCDVAPGPGLGSCLSDACANPSLRVETKVFTVVNDRNAINFADYADVLKAGGKYQAKNLATAGGNNVEFLGSTTGPKYTEQACSPLQVTWNVNSDCAKVDIASLSNFCGNNVFAEDHAHGVRELVMNPKLLAPIK